MKLDDKKVLCASVICEGERSFEEILLNEKTKQTLPYKHKMIELSHLNDEGEFVTGMFVATQQKDIPPVHTPGDEEDYSAVEMGEGQGFAYPNVFLYIKKSKVLLWEVNRMGILESGMEFFFNKVSEMYYENEFSVELLPLLNIEAYERLQKLLVVDTVEFQIAEPIKYLSDDIGKNGSLEEVCKLADKMNASKSIFIRFSADSTKINKLDKGNILSLARTFLRMPPSTHSRVKNKLVVSGKSGDDESLIEETINFVTDRLFGYFRVEKKIIAKDLQVEKRKEGIRIVEIALKKKIDMLI